MGVHRDPDSLVETLRNLRRCVDVSPEVSVVSDVSEKELRLYTDSGRICRPLFVVNEKTMELAVDSTTGPKFVGTVKDAGRER